MKILKKIIGFIALILLAFLAIQLANASLFLFNIFLPPLPSPFPPSLLERLNSIVYTPLSEEFLFRGPIYFVLKSAEIKKEKLSKTSIIWIVLMLFFWSGLAFSLIHFREFGLEIFSAGPDAKRYLYYLGNRMFGGLILGLLVLKTKSLLPPLLVHALVNLDSPPGPLIPYY